MKSRQVQLVEYPRRARRAARTSAWRRSTCPSRPTGEVLVRNTFTSVDPGMRLRLRESGPAGYFNSFPLNAAMDEILTVGEVVESRAKGFAPGDDVSHAYGWRDYAVVTAGEPALGGVGTLRRLDTSIAPAEKFLGPVGNMALTAYVGLVDGAQLREGDVIWISAAAGAVGSLAAQIAKLRGHTVIGSAGSPDKVRYLLDELGLDAAFDYHDGPLVDRLREAAPDGIDVYFDNVGGDHLQAALHRAAPVGPRGDVRRAVGVREPGAAARPDEPVPDRRQQPDGARLPGQRLPAPPAGGHAQLGGWLKEGRLVYRETIVEGLERAPEALVRMLTGDTIGKTLVKVADPQV